MVLTANDQCPLKGIVRSENVISFSYVSQLH